MGERYGITHLHGPRRFAGLTMRRDQLHLPVGNQGMPIHVWRTAFVGGPGPAERTEHRLIASPERWAVYLHRQAQGIVKIKHVHETRLQESLWERLVYERIRLGDDFATYRLVDDA